MGQLFVLFTGLLVGMSTSLPSIETPLSPRNAQILERAFMIEQMVHDFPTPLLPKKLKIVHLLLPAAYFSKLGMQSSYSELRELSFKYLRQSSQLSSLCGIYLHQLLNLLLPTTTKSGCFFIQSIYTSFSKYFDFIFIYIFFFFFFPKIFKSRKFFSISHIQRSAQIRKAAKNSAASRHTKIYKIN